MVQPATRYEELKVRLTESASGVEEISAIVGIPEWWPTGERVAVVFAHAGPSDHEDPLIVALSRGLTERALRILDQAEPLAPADAFGRRAAPLRRRAAAP